MVESCSADILFVKDVWWTYERQICWLVQLVELTFLRMLINWSRTLQF